MGCCLRVVFRRSFPTHLPSNHFDHSPVSILPSPFFSSSSLSSFLPQLPMKLSDSSLFPPHHRLPSFLPIPLLLLAFHRVNARHFDTGDEEPYPNPSQQQTQMQYPPHQYWPSPIQTNPSSPALVQEENHPAAWSLSHSEPKSAESQNVRSFHRYIFQNAQFARPPDPQTIWQQKLNSEENKQLIMEHLWGKPEIPQAIRNYFSLDIPPEKVVKELTGVDLHNLLGPHFDQFLPDGTTATPGWTRPTTPKDKLVEYFEKSLDNFLGGKFRAMERLPYLSQKIESLDEQPKDNSTLTTSDAKKQKDGDELLEGSGEEPNEMDNNDVKKSPKESSISGIPRRIPFIPKVPSDFIARQEDPPAEFVSKIIEMNTKEGMEKEQNELEMNKRDPVLEETNLAREAGMVAKTVKEQFQYGVKPSYQQGVLSSVLNFLGINSSPQTGTELDQALTEWIMEHSPKYTTKHEKRAHREESSYARLQKFLSAPLTPLCTPQPELMDNFDVNAFMGQWFEVMYSPLVSSSACSVMFYRMLGSSPGGVGSVFQTLQYSSPKRAPPLPDDGFPWEEQQQPILPTAPQQPMLTSGYAIVSRPGQIMFKRSKSAEEVAVHIIDAGFGADLVSLSSSSLVPSRYEYAILGINCNYPLFVIARDPYTFKQKYEKTVMETLKRKGLINDVSRLLNIVTTINPAHCLVPSHFFNAQNDQPNWAI